jgi:uncharacterized protein YqgC (DUF456 family)
METDALLLFALVMAVGLAGVLVPVVPGLLIVGAATVGWAWWDGSPAAWVVAGAMVVVLLCGTAAKYVLPGRTLKDAGAPWSTLLLGAAAAIVGFFVIPVVGLVVGGVLGVWAGELVRLRDRRGAWRSTWATIKAIGLGMVVELTAGVLAVAGWAVAVLVMR